MADEDTITLTDLARLARVGRNAVSNWRRREPDFPSPVDPAAARPRFALADVERWAAGHGRTLHLSPADRLWFRLSATQATPEAALRAIASGLDGDGELAEPLREITETTPPAELFEFFVERAREAAGVGAPAAAGAIADIVNACAPDEITSVHDPACGEGDLLMTILSGRLPTRTITGRDLSIAHAAIAATRLRLHNPHADVHMSTGDSLLSPLPSERYDLVVCDPPFSVKDSGHERAPAGDDPRLAYGAPPRTEPELAWALHCLALLAPRGVAVVRMPAAVAHRRSGRRLRSELLRWGALRAVVDHPGSKAHVWVLRGRTDGDTPSRLLVSTGEDIAEAWGRFTADPHAELSTAHSTAVPLMRLWDADVDVSPDVYLSTTDAAATDLAGAVEALTQRLKAIPRELPRFSEPARASTTPESSLADLERDGLVELHNGPAELDGRHGILVDLAGTEPVRLGALEQIGLSQWGLVCEPASLDPAWLAAALAARLPTAVRRTATGARRRLLAVKIPRLAIEEQRRRGAAFEQLLRLRDDLEAARRQTSTLAADAAAALLGDTTVVE